jgi:hypothetical protein
MIRSTNASDRIHPGGKVINGLVGCDSDSRLELERGGVNSRLTSGSAGRSVSRAIYPMKRKSPRWLLLPAVSLAKCCAPKS